MSSKTFSIIIIDDEPSIRNGIKNIIEKELEGVFIPALAKNAAEGFELIKQYNPDLIISDIVMPGLTGLELLKKLREEGYDTPVILISGYDEFAYAQQAIKLSVSAYILKPISKNELLATILKEMNNKVENNKYRYDDEAIKAASNMFLERLIRGEVKSEEEASKGIKAFIPNMKEGDKTVCIIVAKSKAVDLSAIDYLASFPYLGYTIVILPGKEQYAIHSMRILLEYDNTLQISVGCSVNQFYLLTKSYNSALLSLSYSFYKNGNKLFTQSDISTIRPNMTTSDIDSESVKSILLTRNEEEIEKWIDKFINSLLDGGTPPPNYIKGMCIFLLNDVTKRLYDSSLLNKNYLENLTTYEINKVDSIGELKDILNSKLKYLMNISIPDSIMGNDPIIHRARQMVLSSYDKLIKSSDIAEKLGMNASYFSVYFKNKTGENFRDFTNRVKIDEGKRLLIESDLSVEEIALSLGYSDYRSFNRIFRGQTGKTPSDFRKDKV